MTASLRAGDLSCDTRARRRAAFERLDFDRTNGCSPDDVRQVLVIAAASRSGSSFLHRVLASHPEVVSLNGEGGVFERLHGLGRVSSTEGSDLVAERRVPFSLISEDMLRDAGCLCQGGEPPARELLADSVQRLLLQHPEADLDPDRLFAAARAALARRGPGDLYGYWRELLGSLGARFRAEDYDMPGAPAAEGPAGRPPPFERWALEEPPFVVPRPRSLPAPAELRRKTLLLKSSADAYRLWLLPRLFPRARVRFVFLTRNPAGAINGLMDGWTSDAFQSHNVSAARPLRIEGYTRPDRPWTRAWWKFDLPPGWGERAEARLEDVCAFQWRSANDHLLAAIESGVMRERLRLRYEDLLGSASRRRSLDAVLEFAGLSPQPLSEEPAVMAVLPPGAGKWKKRAPAIEAALHAEPVRATAERLGYDPRRRTEWP